MTLIFKGETLEQARAEAHFAGVSNCHAWSRRAWLNGVWTLAYEVAA
jgi:hypothetical protein